jgi:redox-sensitive bicupin YhaK (pirin superfamily)
MERREFVAAVGAVGLGTATNCASPRTDNARLDTRTSAVRSIAYRTRGSTHGPITRLVSPSDVGELIKPFVFLDRIAMPAGNPLSMGWHPHSGIATVTYVLEGAAGYEETTGAKGVVQTGGVEWMRASGGVWHTGGPVAGQPVRGFQLWVALPASLENVANESAYLGPAQIPSVGPARVVLGRLGSATSPVPSPPGMTYLAVTLAAGERWTYEPPADHEVAFLAVHQGSLSVPDTVAQGELVVFAEGSGAIVIEAKTTTDFVLGSAVKHPYDLVVGRYSVHTSREALREGEATIARMGREHKQAGRFGLATRRRG